MTAWLVAVGTPDGKMGDYVAVDADDEAAALVAGKAAHEAQHGESSWVALSAVPA